MTRRPPNLAPRWIALGLTLCIAMLAHGIWQRVNHPSFPAAGALPLHQAGAVIRDLAGLHPPGDNPWP